MWETKDVLLILGVVSGAVTTIAFVRAQLASLITSQRITEDSVRRIGERVGKCETILTVNAAVAKHLRTPVFGTSIPRELRETKTDEGTGEHER
jgi:hypothetical protein